jgi:hypothetical protein
MKALPPYLAMNTCPSSSTMDDLTKPAPASASPSVKETEFNMKEIWKGKVLLVEITYISKSFLEMYQDPSISKRPPPVFTKTTSSRAAQNRVFPASSLASACASSTSLKSTVTPECLVNNIFFQSIRSLSSNRT